MPSASLLSHIHIDEQPNLNLLQTSLRESADTCTAFDRLTSASWNRGPHVSRPADFILGGRFCHLQKFSGVFRSNVSQEDSTAHPTMVSDLWKRSLVVPNPPPFPTLSPHQGNSSSPVDPLRAIACPPLGSPFIIALNCASDGQICQSLTPFIVNSLLLYSFVPFRRPVSHPGVGCPSPPPRYNVAIILPSRISPQLGRVRS